MAWPDAGQRAAGVEKLTDLSRAWLILNRTQALDPLSFALACRRRPSQKIPALMAAATISQHGNGTPKRDSKALKRTTTTQCLLQSQHVAHVVQTGAAAVQPERSADCAAG
jgi:hypothetical protein